MRRIKIHLLNSFIDEMAKTRTQCQTFDLIMNEEKTTLFIAGKLDRIGVLCYILRIYWNVIAEKMEEEERVGDAKKFHLSVIQKRKIFDSRR